MARELLYWKLNFYALYQSIFKECSDRYNLTELEMEILLFLKQNRDYNTARDICALHSLPKSNVSNSVRLLERKGYLKIQIDDSNRKVHRLWLTDKSEEVTENLQKAQDECFRITFDGISEEEKDFMYHFGERCNQNVLTALYERNKMGAEEEFQEEMG